MLEPASDARMNERDGDMVDYIGLTDDFFKAYRDAANAEASPHRRAILENFIEHVALEHSADRWREILDTERTVENPVYNMRLGSPLVHLEGREAVIGFYSHLKKGVLTNEHINLAVADWGFSSFFKIHLFMPGDTMKAQGAPIDDEGAFYHIEMPLVGMYWDYDERARLIGENVYDILPPIYTKMDPADAPTQEEVDKVIQKYLPKQRVIA